MAPGSRLLAFASHWFDERTVARVFEPLIADYQREWANASAVRQRIVTARAVSAFVVSVVALSPRALLLTPTPPSITRRIIARMILFCSVCCGLMMIPFLTQLGEVPPGRLAWLVLWLVPSMLLIAFPFAMGFVVDGARRHAQPTSTERIAILRAALIGVVFTVLLNGWMVPAANQQFRMTTRSDAWQTPARGMRELSTLELMQHSPSDAYQRELHNRASIALLPAVLMWMRWRALNHPTPQWFMPAWVATIATFTTYLMLRWNDSVFEGFYGLPPGGGAWVPLAAFVLIGFTRDYFARRV